MTIDELREKYGTLSEFQHSPEGTSVFWIFPEDYIGFNYFSFDKKTVYNLFADFPHNLSENQVRVFCKENPYWADFFRERIKGMGITV